MILGIETATQICGVALTRGDSLIAEYRLNLKNSHARLLAGIVEKIMADSRVTFADLAVIAISIGPGSFTGLRIGLAFAKGAAFSHHLPVVAVPTLHALASQAPIADGMVCAVLRSRANEYYMALYERRGFAAHPAGQVAVVSADVLFASIPKGCLLVAEPNCGLNVLDHAIAPVYFTYLSAYTIARLGAERLAQGQVEDSDSLEPAYMQEFITGQPKAGLL
jgi:tRNA threonylcarbamoyladenosine biosynthesis protein TsaB